MCDHQWSVQIDSDSGQASDSSVNSGNNDAFVANLVLYNPRTIFFFFFFFFHFWECDAMTRSVVKRSPNENRVNCLFHIIGQSDMLSFYGIEREKKKKSCIGHRGLSGTNKIRRRSV